MIAINLLPYELRPIKHSVLPYLAAALIFVVALVGIGGMWLQLHGEIREQQDLLAKHEREWGDLEAIVVKFEQLRAQRALLAEKMEVINEVVKDRIIWSRQLWNISRLTPDNFWYSKIREKKTSGSEMHPVKNPKTGKVEMKPKKVTYRDLELAGYVVQGEDGSNDINTLMFKFEQDAEFSGLFQLSLSNLEDTEFEGYGVRGFTLEYRIQEKAEEQAK